MSLGFPGIGGSGTGSASELNGVNLSGLGTGLLKNTSGTGATSIAIPGTDFPGFSDNTKFSSFITRSAYFGTTGSIGANFTILSEVAAPAPYDYVRFVYLNFDTTAHTIGNTACASAPTQGNNGTALTWTQMTFSTTPTVSDFLPGVDSSSTDTTS